ncbi:MAG: HIT family protein [Anaerolineae bacterium]
MPEAPTEWMPREEWDALVRGDDCPLCAEVAGVEPANEYGYTVADLAISRLRLAANQSVPGYCVLICHRHAREPFELSPEDRTLFFEDMLHAAAVIESVYGAIKMNYQILGNAVPHVHAHIVPRYYGDPAPSRPIDPGAATVLLSAGEYQARAVALREALGIASDGA